MLKALELSGFKSFADKTRFEFPPGITVVVGPNGSGKSNIVDALKWVLGEQSAKSLRGKDMSDVIFKGSSGPGSRKPAGSASATLVLDNTDGRLLYDSPEVSVTRRVYRSGESEYLINGAPVRLKDIRNLFRGTGIGTDAYSLIEQGKVERLLQASPKDRRAIFEEAAGISRFKARKVESERRLERVQTNLVRLADIVEEVGSRYRSVKSQASRAARYREWSTRLQELRTWVGFKDYRSLTSRVESLTASLAEFTETVAICELGIAEAQTETTNLEQALETLTLQINEYQEQVAGLRESIVQAESRIELEKRRQQDLQDRNDLNSKQLELATKRLTTLDETVAAAESEYAEAREIQGQMSKSLESLGSELAAIDSELERLTSNERSNREQLAAMVNESGELAKSTGVLNVRLESSRAEQIRFETALASTESEEGNLERQLSHIESLRISLTEKAEEGDSALRSARESVDSLDELLAAKQQLLADRRSSLTGVQQRSRVIAELEKKLESANTGIREVLKMGKQEPALGVVGMVADLIQVNVRHAALVDAALGPVAQHIVTRDDSLIRRIAMGDIRVPGRVGIISEDSLDVESSPRGNSPADQPGVVGPADSLIDSIDPAGKEVIRRLLDSAWIVESLTVALTLGKSGFSHCRFVTLDGEVLENDGTVMAGAKSSIQGIVSRRSELRALAGDEQALESEVSELEQTISNLKKELVRGKKQVQSLLVQNQEIASELAKHDARQQQVSEQRIRVLNEKKNHQSGLATVIALVAELTSALESEGERHRGLESGIARLQADVDQARQTITKLTSDRSGLEQQATTARVQLARAEQQTASFQSRLNELARQKDETVEGIRQLEGQLESDRKTIAESVTVIRETENRLAEISAERETIADQLQRKVDERTSLDRARKQFASRLAENRSKLRLAQDELNANQLKISQLQMECDQLSSRLLEDYGIKVAEMASAETPEQAEDREKVDAEITSLREKIGSLGSVNMEALAELEELEKRYQHLDSQYQDLVAARDSLLKIIQRINNDSRKLFAETLEAIRLNFQKLFRQTFGGGQADIILEEGVDVLEAGVDIIATPPGKPKFSNSLLSGGEKALTAVSLLMAIFQYRPSPFCVLDEVDAPFDEANIGRFIDVLKSFLGWTRFVIVTHSKKTMTAATTLYGVTMQESGVSKRVSVRFEDVSEDGHISEDAVRRAPQDDEDDHRTVA